MSPIDFAFDDFVDDCFIEQDPICGLRDEMSPESVASKLISGLVSEPEDIKAA